MVKLDENDLKILDVLKDNSKLSSSKIAKKTGIPMTTVFNRIKRLEKENIIQKYSIQLNQKKLGNIITAYIFMHYDVSVWGKDSVREQVKKSLLALPNVEEIKYTAGRFDIILKIMAPDMDFLNEIILDRLRKIPGIGHTESFFVLEDVK